MSSTDKPTHITALDALLISKNSKVSVYTPFLLALTIIILLTGVSAIVLGHSIMSDYMRVMNLFMGFFYIVFAIPKLGNLGAFAHSFSAYDIVAKRSKRYALMYPFLELLLGAELLINNNMSHTFVSRLTIAIIILISTIGLASVTKALIEKRKIDCACLGSNFSFPLSKISFIENGLMLVMAITMLFLPMASAMPNTDSKTTVQTPSMHMDNM